MLIAVTFYQLHIVLIANHRAIDCTNSDALYQRRLLTVNSSVYHRVSEWHPHVVARHGGQSGHSGRGAAAICRPT